MAAISAVLHLLQPGDHLLTTADIYIGTYLYLGKIAEGQHLKWTFLDDLTEPAKFEAAIQPNTKVPFYTRLYGFS